MKQKIIANQNIENSNIDNVEENKEEQVPDKTEEVVEEPTNDVPTTDNSEFDSSVAFIGDSRTQAFLMYTGLKKCYRLYKYRING